MLDCQILLLILHPVGVHTLLEGVEGSKVLFHVSVSQNCCQDFLANKFFKKINSTESISAQGIEAFMTVTCDTYPVLARSAMSQMIVALCNSWINVWSRDNMSAIKIQVAAS